ncbi:hypothetical protein Anas_11446 [Armadillidium nasatum]|uniref:Uncharacterized protein n=1 Tax=Armadillidium nasatum TaxID=96803 RepID=A0A5N5SU07_9CRUS|nr:hypothetical protein Anas_11446 [Armadillidium nasatum]
MLIFKLNIKKIRLIGKKYGPLQVLISIVSTFVVDIQSVTHYPNINYYNITLLFGLGDTAYAGIEEIRKSQGLSEDKGTVTLYG